MDEEKERQKEIKETLENAGLDPDLSACGSPAQAGEFDEGEQPACADPPACNARAGASAGREELADLL